MTFDFVHSGMLRKNPGEPPMLPFIPPPPITPSPSHSRQNSLDSWSSSVSGAKLGTSLDKNEGLNTSDVELSPDTKRQPLPQEYLRFVFDNSNQSDCFVSTDASSDSTVTAEATTTNNNIDNSNRLLSKNKANGI